MNVFSKVCRLKNLHTFCNIDFAIKLEVSISEAFIALN